MLMPTITKKSWTFEKTMKQCAYKIQGHIKKIIICSPKVLTSC